MEEIWKPVVGYEGLYEVSNLGQVRSVDRYVEAHTRNGKPYTVHYAGKVLKQGRRQDGYADVPLSKQGKTVLRCTHRLIAEAFLEKPEGCECVNHIDLDKTNNSLSNLEWVTYAENTSHAVHNYANPQSIPIHCKETNQIYSSMGECDKCLDLYPGTTWKVVRENFKCQYHLSIASVESVQQVQATAVSNLGWTFQYSKKGRLYPVRQIKCIELGSVYDSLKSASLATCCSEDGIRESIRKHSQCKNYTFYYLDCPPDDESEYQQQCKQTYYINTHHRKKVETI